MRDQPRSSALWMSVGITVAVLSAPVQGLAQDQGRMSWKGAWEWVHPSFDGRLLLLDHWFCAVFGAKDRPLPEPGDLTEREAAELFRSMPGPMCGSVTVFSTEEQPLTLETVPTIVARPRNRGARRARPTRIEGSRMHSDLLRSDGSVATTWIHDRLEEPGTSSLAGAWQLDSEPWTGLLLMTDSEYRYVIELRERTSFESSNENLTDEHAAYLYASYDAQGGRFSVSGNRMTRVPDIAKDPRLQGKEIVGSFQLNGTSLTTEFGGTRRTWRRVQSPPDGNGDGNVAGVEIIRDLPYARYGDRTLRLDLFRPAEPSHTPRPAVVLIRGGSWRRGDKDYFGEAGIELARRGLVTVSIELRPSTEAVFPAALQDVKAALRWLRAQAAHWEIDPDRLGTMGHSSGAQLALLAALTPDDPGLEGDGGNPDESSAVQAVVGLGSATMFLTHPDLVPAQEFFGGPLEERREVWRLGSPLVHVAADAPPALLMYGAEDRVVPLEQSLDFVEAYARLGLDVEFVQLAGAPHAFWNREGWGDYTLDRAAAFFHRHLGARDGGS